MDMHTVDIECPNCKLTIKIPFFEDLKAQSIADDVMFEVGAKEQLGSLRYWLRNASLFQLFKYWLKR